MAEPAKVAGRRAAGAAIVSGALGVMLVLAGLGGRSIARAETPAYPIADSFGDGPIGIVQMDAGGQVTILMTAGVPYTRYTASVCSIDSQGDWSCATPDTGSTFTANAAGEGSTAFTLSDPSLSAQYISIADAAGDVYVATVAPLTDLPSLPLPLILPPETP